MKRRDFLTAAAGIAVGSALPQGTISAFPGDHHAHHGRTYATPKEAMTSPREELAYVVGVDIGGKRPDFLATIDLDPSSKSYSKIVHRLSMPNIGDELHHFGWNACASCHGERARTHLIVPGLRSSRIHIIDTSRSREPRLVKVIEPEEVIRKTRLTAPHTVHCRADGMIMISMLGNEKGDAPGGFLLLDEKFNIAGRWEADLKGMAFNYDFWYQPRHNVMVSSEWGAPNTTRPGFKLEDVQAGKYGRHLHFWDWEKKTISQSLDLGQKGLIPLEVRFHHNPDSTHGFVGAALSSVIWHWWQDDKTWKAEPIVEVESQEVQGWPFPVPGLITDVVLSMDDRWLYFSNWLHGDIRQYDVSDPGKPRLTGQLWLGGVLGKPSASAGEKPSGGPQMLQLSLDGKRLYVTNSLFSSWDDQFYPKMAEQGSWMRMIDCDTTKGGMTLNNAFLVDFGKESGGPTRAHEMRFLRGDSTSDIWM